MDEVEQCENVYYAARDWVQIGANVYEKAISPIENGVPADMKDFGAHIVHKANRIADMKSGDYVYGETLTTNDAVIVRDVAKEQQATEYFPHGGGE